MYRSQCACRACLAAWAFCILLAPGSYAQYLEPVWEHVEWGEYLGATNLWNVDLDGDGLEELVLGGGHIYPYGAAEGNLFFFVLEHRDGDYVPRWTSRRYAENPIRLIEVLERGGRYEVLVVLADGRVERYDGATMTLLNTTATDALSASYARVADLDGDGQMEIAIASEGTLLVYEAATLALEERLSELNVPTQAKGFAVGNVDADAAPEIVLADGRVWDLAAGAFQWTYAGGFGREVDLADLDGDGVSEIIGMSDWDYITAFDAAHRTPLWQISTGEDLASLLVTDVEADGTPEIVVGSDQWGAVRGYSTATQQLLWSLGNPEHATTRIAVGDPDGDGAPEVVWGAGHFSTGPDVVIVASPESQQVEWQSLDLDGPFMAGLADLDGDGTPEIVGASQRSRSSYDGGYVLVFDAGTHRLLRSTLPSWSTAIEALATGDVDGDGRGEILVGMGEQLQVLDGRTLELRWQSPYQGNSATITAIAIADVDADPAPEILVGDDRGVVSILDGRTFEQAWQSIATGGRVNTLRVASCDADEAPEILFSAEDGIIQIYDSQTHHLEWQSLDVRPVTAMDVADLDLDGTPEIVAGHQDGQITEIRCGSFDVRRTFQAGNGVTGLRAVNLDRTPEKELLVGTGSNPWDPYYGGPDSALLKVFSSRDTTLLWQSRDLGTSVGWMDALHTADLDADQQMDVVVGSRWGLFHFEAAETFPDLTPPRVVAVTPPPGLRFVGTDTGVDVVFSEAVDPATLAGNVSVQTAAGQAVATTTDYDAPTYTLHLAPSPALPPRSEIVVTVSGLVADTSGNGIDANRNGISEGTPIDDLTWSFWTGAGVDTVGPRVTGVRLESDSVWTGITVDVTAWVSDSSEVAISGLAEAELFVDRAGPSGTGVPLVPADSLPGRAFQEMYASFRTDTLSPGAHTLLVHGRDVRGNWGPFARHTFHVLGEEASTWTTFGHDARHTGFNPQDSIRVPLALAWSRAVSPYPLNSPAVAAGTVFVTRVDPDAVVYALDAETGEELWSHSFGDIYSIDAPAVAYGRVYVQSNNHTPGSYVTAFDLLTGRMAWQTPFDTQWAHSAGPTPADGKVFVNAGYYGGMMAFDAFTGETLWSQALPQQFGWTPAYDDGVAYAAWSGAAFYAVAADTGGVLYPFGNPGYNAHTPVIHDGVLFTTDPVAAVDLDTRTVLWSKSGTVPPAVGYGRVFTVVDGMLQVYDEATGQTLWAFEGDRQLNRSPVLANGYVFASSDAATYAVDIETQQLAWSFEQGGHLAVAGHRLYLASPSGTLYAFHAASTVSMEAENALPESYTLRQNYPNPFNPATRIEYELPQTGPVLLQIFNAMGQLVATLVEERQSAGRYEVSWNAQELGSGVYFCRLQAGAFSGTRQMVLLK